MYTLTMHGTLVHRWYDTCNGQPVLWPSES